MEARFGYVVESIPMRFGRFKMHETSAHSATLEVLLACGELELVATDILARIVAT